MNDDSKRAKSIVNMLHLTDLHFSATDNLSARVHRTLVLNDLIDQFEDLLAVRTEERDQPWSEDVRDWKPDIIAISGDIAYAGNRKDYEEAGKFLHQLRSKCNDPKIIACPGNHDRDSTFLAGLTYPLTAAKADEWLSIECLQPTDDTPGRSPLVVPFHEFQEFCKRERFLCRRSFRDSAIWWARYDAGPNSTKSKSGRLNSSC